MTDEDQVFAFVPGVMRGHGKTPHFRAGMKCLPHRHIPRLSTTRAYKILCDPSTGDRDENQN